MRIHIIDHPLGGKFPLLLDDNNDIVEPVKDYIKHLRNRGCSYNTQLNEAHHLKIYFEWLEENNLTYVDAVHNRDKDHNGAYENLSDFKLYLKYPDIKPKVIPIKPEAKRQVSTVNTIISVVSAFYRYLASVGLMDDLPIYMEMIGEKASHSFLNQMFLKKEHAMVNLLLEKAPQKKIKYITREQYDKLWDACISLRDKVIIGLLYEGALRKSEVIGLNLSDLIGINENRIDINYHYDPDNMTFLKYDSSGTTYVSDRLRDTIIEYINNELAYVDTNYLLVNFKKGEHQYKPMSSHGIDKIFERLSKAVGFKVTAHMLRHGCAAYLANRGMKLSDIQDKLRHKNYETTRDIYIHFFTETKKKMEMDYKSTLDKITTSDGKTLDDIINDLLGEDD